MGINVEILLCSLQKTIPVTMTLAMAEKALARLNGSMKADPKINEKSKKNEKAVSEEDSKKQEIVSKYF